MTASDEGKIGDIYVTMRDGNSVGNIGHIVFQEPPPDPNAIWQDGKPVGVMGTAPVEQEGAYFFQKLFIDSPFDPDRPFSVQGVKLKIDQFGTMTLSSSGGRPPLRTFWDVLCSVIP